ncbi:MAG: hypothetical protein HY925_16730 [Elusimicrobia bacterium]|nr:hypothetical protein [Elusimicrobiota bacterium]
MEAVFKYLSAVCVFALALSGPLGPALTHAATHAIADAHEHSHHDETHCHEHNEASHHHEFLKAAVTPATITNTPTIDPVRRGRNQLASASAARSFDAISPALAESFDTGPPEAACSLLLALTLTDRAPPA